MTLAMEFSNNTDYGHPMISFFLNIQNILEDLDRSAEYVVRYFWNYYLLKFFHCVSVVCDFVLLGHVFCKKLRFLYILQDFRFGFGMWIWDLVIMYPQFVSKNKGDSSKIDRYVYLNDRSLVQYIHFCSLKPKQLPIFLIAS